MLKLLNRILDDRIRAVVAEEIGEEQQEFRQRRGITGGDICPEAPSGKKLKGQGVWQLDSQTWRRPCIQSQET